MLKDYPAETQPVHPAAIWQAVQNCPAQVSWDCGALSWGSDITEIIFHNSGLLMFCKMGNYIYNLCYKRITNDVEFWI